MNDINGRNIDINKLPIINCTLTTSVVSKHTMSVGGATLEKKPQKKHDNKDSSLIQSKQPSINDKKKHSTISAKHSSTAIKIQLIV